MFTGTVENEFGIKVPRTYLYGTATLLGRPGRIAGRYFGFSGGHKLVNYLYDTIESNKLKDLRKNPNEYSKHIQSLKKRYSAQRVNKIISGSK